jgi:hypothetical protein
VSVEAISWALNLFPVPADRGGWLSSACEFVLVGLASHAGSDGAGASPSTVRYGARGEEGRGGGYNRCTSWQFRRGDGAYRSDSELTARVDSRYRFTPERGRRLWRRRTRSVWWERSWRKAAAWRWCS